MHTFRSLNVGLSQGSTRRRVLVAVMSAVAGQGSGFGAVVTLSDHPTLGGSISIATSVPFSIRTAPPVTAESNRRGTSPSSIAKRRIDRVDRETVAVPMD